MPGSAGRQSSFSAQHSAENGGGGSARHSKRNLTALTSNEIEIAEVFDM